MDVIKVQYEDLPKGVGDPALNYCRKLLADGYDFGCRLEYYRGEQLDLTISSIGEGAKLTVYEEPYVHFTKFTPMSDRARSSFQSRGRKNGMVVPSPVR